MLKKTGPVYKHNYKWLFRELRRALERAETDPEFNRTYEFHHQKGAKLHWPQRLLNEIAPFYEKKIGIRMDGRRLKTKVLNTRVHSFRASARGSNFSEDYLFVDEFDPRRLTFAAPAKPLRTFYPAPKVEAVPAEAPVVPVAPVAPVAPPAIPARPSSLGSTVASIGLDARAQVEIMAQIATQKDLESLDADMRMAVVLCSNM